MTGEGVRFRNGRVRTVCGWRAWWTRGVVRPSTEVQALLAFRATQDLLEAKHGERWVVCVEVRSSERCVVELEYPPLHSSSHL